MTKRRVYGALAGVVLVSAIVLAAVFGMAQDEPDSTAAIGGSVGDEIAQRSGGETDESVHISGHWTIEVREPDGTLVSRHEFDNAFVGRRAFSSYLARSWTVGPWEVRLDGPQRPWQVGPNTTAPGRVVEPDHPEVNQVIFRTLTATVPDTGPNADKLVLSGTAVAWNDGTLDSVYTTQCYCSPSVAPSDCNTFQQNLISQATIGTVPVSAGQQILVEVVIDCS